LSLDIQKDILKLKEYYKNFLEGNLSIDEFWNSLFPFVNEFLHGQNYRAQREKIGQINVDSIVRLLINLRDKRQSYNEYKDLGDIQQARIEERLFVSITRNIVEKIESLNISFKDNKNKLSFQTNGRKDNGYLNVQIDKKEKQMDTHQNNDLIFISYAQEDFDYAERLYNDLKNAGLNPWLDKEELLPGQNWDREIRKVVKSSKFFLPLFSSRSVEKRGYIQREYRLGIETAQEMPEGQIFIIPIRIDECQIPFESLSDIHYQDMFPYWNKGIERIIRVIEPNV
jgi:hypothetical protein